MKREIATGIQDFGEMRINGDFTAANALKQIEEKKYDVELLDRGIPAERILKYSLAFHGKECLIRKGR